MVNPHFRSRALDSRVLFEHSKSVRIYIYIRHLPYASIDDVISVWIPFH